MRTLALACFFLLLPLIANPSIARGEPDYCFNGHISREVLENYLSRAVTHSYLCAEDNEGANPYFADDLRMLTEIGAKFIGRDSIIWVAPDDIEGFFQLAEDGAVAAHQADPEFILQAGIFECVSANIDTIPVPAGVFQDFGLSDDTQVTNPW